MQVATVISGNLTLRVCGLDTLQPYQTWWRRLKLLLFVGDLEPRLLGYRPSWASDRLDGLTGTGEESLFLLWPWATSPWVCSALPRASLSEPHGTCKLGSGEVIQLRLVTTSALLTAMILNL